MRIDVPEEIKEWAFWLSRGSLGPEKLPLCPWAKKSVLEGRVDYWIDENPGDLVPLPPEIKVRIVSLPNIDLEGLCRLCSELNQIHKDWVFLESHPEDTETIGGIKTVFSSPLVLIQSRGELEKSRSYLRKGNYYSYWDPEVLDRILGT